MLMHTKKYTEYMSNIWYLCREILDFTRKKSIFFIHKDVSRVVKLVLIKKQRINKYILDFIRLCNKNYRLF